MASKEKVLIHILTPPSIFSLFLVIFAQACTLIVMCLQVYHPILQKT